MVLRGHGSLYGYSWGCMKAWGWKECLLVAVSALLGTQWNQTFRNSLYLQESSRRSSCSTPPDSGPGRKYGPHPSSPHTPNPHVTPSGAITIQTFQGEKGGTEQPPSSAPIEDGARRTSAQSPFLEFRGKDLWINLSGFH